jgi:heptosyltransferase II
MKILVIQKKRIGDVLTSSIILEALKIKFPGSETHYLVYENAFSVVKNNPFIDKIVILDEKSRKGKLAFLKFLFKIRREKYNVVIDAYGKPNSVIIGFFSGAKTTISFEKSYTKLLYSNTVKRIKQTSSSATLAIEHRMQLLEPLNFERFVLAPKIFLLTEEKEIAEQNLIQHKIDFSFPIIMISAIGSNQSKTYRLESMAKVLDCIVNNNKASQLLFNYLPNQKNQALELFKLCKKETQAKIYFDFYESDLRSFLATTSLCAALIGNEGGATNMAKALGIPTFTIFSPEVPKNDWNIFENDTTNISVHIDDFLDTSLMNFEEKNIAFSPSFFENQLINFLNFNCR